MGIKLLDSFFLQPSVDVAKQLIGKVLVYDSPQGLLSGHITETEAYTQEDPACHAFMGKVTSRTRVMFQAPGTLYIYFIYGKYYCLNFVTESIGRGCAVLIRGISPLEGIDIMIKNRTVKSIKTLTNGPSKLVEAFGIPADLNGLMYPESPLYIQDVGYRPRSVKATSRIGISKGNDLLWRFIEN